MSKRALSDAQLTFMCEDYVRGAPPQVLAVRYKIDVTTVYKWLHLQGIHVRKRSRKMSPTEIKQARHKLKRGATIAELAEEYNVHRTTMWRCIHNKSSNPKRKRRIRS